MSRSYYAGETRWRIAQAATTNDLGEYRVAGLSPGRYVVGVDAYSYPSPRGVSNREFAASFYPGADSPEQATPVPLSWGSEASGIDFRLPAAPDTTVQGVVLDGSTGEPCERCQIFIQETSGLRSSHVTPTREGVFVMRGVRPGPCWVVALERASRNNQAAEQVAVAASGATEVKLVIGAGQTISAEVVLEDPPKHQEESPQQAGRRGPPGTSITLQGRGPATFVRPPRANAPPDGGPVDFEKVAPGSYRVQVRSSDDGYLRAISLGGRVLEQPEITVAPDTPLSGLELHVAFDGGTVEGTVKYSSGTEPPARFWVVIVPEPGTSPYAEREMIGGGDGQDNFHKAGLIPGSYSLYAVPPGNAFDLDDPAVRHALEPFSKKVTLAKGETVTVELTYVSAAM
jgi:hypothetical protein